MWVLQWQWRLRYVCNASFNLIQGRLCFVGGELVEFEPLWKDIWTHKAVVATSEFVNVVIVISDGDNEREAIVSIEGKSVVAVKLSGL